MWTAKGGAVKSHLARLGTTAWGEFEITIQPPTVKYRVTLEQLRRWTDGGGKSPQGEQLIKQRVRERLAL